MRRLAHVLILGGLGLAAAMMSHPQRASAEEDFDSAEYIMPGCRQFVQEKTQFFFLDGNCNGILETLRFMSPDICAPPGSTLVEAARIVVQYIDQRPNRLSENFRELALEALTEAWQCRR